MKVLVDHQIFVAQKFGGISRYFNELSKTDMYEVDNIDVNEIEQYKIGNKAVSIPERGLRYIKRRLGSAQQPNPNSLPQSIYSKINEGDFDVFHPTYYDTYFLNSIKKPFVLTVYDMIHEIYSEYFSLSDSVLKNKKILCQKASHIIAISEQTKSDLIQIFGIDAAKVSVTYLASDFNKIMPIKPLVNNELKNYILFVGNRGIYKNFYFFIQSLSAVLHQDPSLKLVCTGHTLSGDEYSFLKNLGIAEQVIHVYSSSDSELAWLYSNARVFAFPSLYEGFGFPLLEAFASNCPVISSNGGSLPEIGGDAALYFEPKNALQIQNAALAVLYDKEVREKLVSNGQKRFKDFSWDKCRAETLAVYRSV